MFRAANALAMIAGVGLLTLNNQALSEASLASPVKPAAQSLTMVNLDNENLSNKALSSSYPLDGLAQLSPMLNFDSKIIEQPKLLASRSMPVQARKPRLLSPNCDLQINRVNPLGELALYEQQRPKQHKILIASNKKM